MAPTTRSTEIDGDRAEWSVSGRVVFVRAVKRRDTPRKVFDPPLELGQAFSVMPRKLWDKTLSSFERTRDRSAPS